MEKRIQDIINDYKSLPNKELEYGMNYINNDFNKTKELIIKLTRHLDGLEVSYNNILKEYNRRR
ncbi:hypothetical protein EB155_07000 [archaeon]|nr:hypothetical protein [archaeon]